MTEGRQPGVEPQIMIDPTQMAGVWANFAHVSHSPYEFTLDFVRWWCRAVGGALHNGPGESATIYDVQVKRVPRRTSWRRIRTPWTRKAPVMTFPRREQVPSAGKRATLAGAIAAERVPGVGEVYGVGHGYGAS